MATVLAGPGVDLVRTAEFCPYQVNCRYQRSCRYVETTGHALARYLQKTGEATIHVGMGMLGSVSLLTGVILSMTLFLIPVGIPLALLGVVLLVTAGESTRRL